MLPGPAELTSEAGSPKSQNSRSSSQRKSISERTSPRSPRQQQGTTQRPAFDGTPKVSFTRRESSSPPFSTYSNSPFAQMNLSTSDRVFPIRSVVSIDPTPTGCNIPEGPVGDGFPGISYPEESNATAGRRFARQGSLPKNVPKGEQTSPSDSIVRDASRESSSWSQSSNTFTGSRDGEVRSDRRLLLNIGSDAGSSGSGTTIGAGADLKHYPISTKGTVDETGSLVTARFRHVVTQNGHAVVVGRDGDTLQRCEDEPIHIPGAVQSFGLLIALTEIAGGKLKVRIVSENSTRIIGYTPKQLFDLDSFCDILSEDQTDNLLDHVDFIRDEDEDPAANGPEVFTISIRSPKARKAQKLWCAMHINPSNRDRIICEFEIEDDAVNPLQPPGESTPELPEDTLQSDPSPTELAQSTTNISKPLRVLRNARKRKGEAAAMEVFNIMSQVQEQLAGAPTLDVFLKILVGVIKELTGFHRVMIYQFDQSWNGRVVTELVDPRATKDLYNGLNFPASDIPKQARDLYKINKVRLLYDRDQETARLVCRTVEDLEEPLDLTFAYLRAMSPIHIKYLANMAVRASMSVSINAFDELWGLIACHTYGSKGMRVSFPIRKMCRLVGDSASRNIERLSYASRLQARKLINTVPTESNPSGYIIASSDDLLKLFDADSGLLSIRKETKVLGKLANTQEALAMLEYLRLRKISSVTTSNDIRLDFPDLRYSPGFSTIAGLLLVPLTASGTDFIVLFRKGQVREVKWAGNPYEKFIKQGTEGYLEPRTSFKVWSEKVFGKCREWSEEQIETAAVLCLVYGKFIEVWRQKETALQNSQLTKLLLANSAHEVRTPLNAIINYLEIALEGSIDPETRENLAKSHSASKSLIYVINDLLDLTNTEAGNNLVKEDIFDLPATIREATDIFAGDAKRKQIEYEVLELSGVPRYVLGDQRRVRQAVSNVTANAVQHTLQGVVKVEFGVAERYENQVHIDIVVQDTGIGMSNKKLDDLFSELEQVQFESEEAVLDQPDIDNMITAGKDDPKAIGLGLAVVARIIRNMNGQLRLKSEEGKGSRFVIQLQFALPRNVSDDTKPKTIEIPNIAVPAPPTGKPSTPPVADGEVMLVSSGRRASSNVRKCLSRHESNESVTSTHSFKSFRSGSTAKSEADRLIEAMQEPHLVSVNTKEGGGPRSSRSPSHSEEPYSKSPTLGPYKFLRSQAISRSSPSGSSRPSSPAQAVAGQASVTDSKTPIKAVRVASEPLQPLMPLQAPPPIPRVLFTGKDHSTRSSDSQGIDNFQVLVAEDDPINSKIMMKRLEKVGHSVHLTINGEECSSAYGERPGVFDVVLMDMQMPIVDGLTSTKMIRSFEKTHPDTILSKRVAPHGRIPIFAVSASLLERDRETYINAGFDGWILKPVDFKRLSVLLCGIVEERTRLDSLYKPGKWEQGGWFATEQADVFSASTKPSPREAVFTSPTFASVPEHTDDPISKEQDRLDSLQTDAVSADSVPEDRGQSGTANVVDG